MTNTGYIYFISNRNAIKIGFTKNIERRRKQLQTGNSKELQLLYYIQGDRSTEYYFHRYFHDYKINGEWFDYDFVMQWIKRDKLEKEIQREMGIIKGVN